jgi:phage shock protein A
VVPVEEQLADLKRRSGGGTVDDELAALKKKMESDPGRGRKR